MSMVVSRNEAESRFEIEVDGTFAGFAAYHLRGSVATFPHTVVFPEFRGRGIAQILVKEALDAMQTDGNTVIPTCWYVAEFIGRNPEYAGLLAA